LLLLCVANMGGNIVFRIRTVLHRPDDAMPSAKVDKKNGAKPRSP
jgi:hypothetical protein